MGCDVRIVCFICKYYIVVVTLYTLLLFTCNAVVMYCRECAPGQCPSLASSKYCQPTKSTNLSYRSRQSQRETEPETDMKNEPEVPISTEKGLSPEQEEYCLNTAIQTRTFPAVEVFLPTMDQSVEIEVADRAAVGATGGGSDGGNNTSSSSRKRSRAAPASPPVSKGHGLRILEPVRRGTIIVEYLGEVITAVEGLRRMGQYTASDAFYFAGLDNGLLLDAKAMGSVARFANHSCDPSCVLQKWTVHGECRLVLAAGRDLRAGDEVSTLPLFYRHILVPCLFILFSLFLLCFTVFLLYCYCIVTVLSLDYI